MGCYNVTCGISQFPIIRDDETVNFVIVSEWTKISPRPSYINESWLLVPIPFYGKYNDFGWQKDHPDQQKKYDAISKFLKDELVCVDKIRAKQDKIDNPFKNSKSLNESIHGNVWHLNNPWYKQDIADANRTRTISNFMVSRVVFEALTASVVGTYPEDRIYTRAEIVEALEKFLPILFKNKERRSELCKKLDRSEDEEKELSDLFVADMHPEKLMKEFVKDYGWNSPIGEMLRYVTRDMGNEGRDLIHIKELLENGDVSAEDAVNVFLMKRAMDVLRKSIYPMTGNGSQTGFEPEHEKLIVAMQKLIELDKIRYGDEE
jgi:hypothetical protein